MGELLLWQRVRLYTCTPGSETEEGRPQAPRAPAGAGARVYSPSMGGYEGMLLAILLLLVPPAAKGLHGERGGKAQAVVEKWR